MFLNCLFEGVVVLVDSLDRQGNNDDREYIIYQHNHVVFEHKLVENVDQQNNRK